MIQWIQLDRTKRVKDQAIKEGYDFNNPEHLEEIKKEWNLVEAWDLVY
jgi:hypothetical protein